jgi:hypothetical protein
MKKEILIYILFMINSICFLMGVLVIIDLFKNLFKSFFKEGFKK